MTAKETYASVTPVVRALVSEYTNSAYVHTTDDKPLTDLGLDSIDLIPMLYELEEFYDISIGHTGKALEGATVMAIVDTILYCLDTKRIPRRLGI